MTKRRKVVVALGGNAILSKDPSAEAQQEALRHTARHLVKFIQRGDELVITHGNGPQVGNLLLQQNAAPTAKNPPLPLDTCVAMTEGSIGYWLQNAMDEVLMESGLEKDVATLITQVEVDGDDPAFQNPTKPIGPFFTREQAALEETKGKQYVEDAGRGWRRVVASPQPVSIKEHQIIKKMIHEGIVVITVGGGGIPVIREGNRLRGVEAVIDKDFASQKLAELLEADLFIILTSVDNVYLNYNQVNQTKLDLVTVAECQKYMEAGQFAKGSMQPKIQAAMNFVAEHPDGKAIITSLENVEQVIEGTAGTVIVKENILNKV